MFQAPPPLRSRPGPPRGRFTVNWDSPQAEGLKHWWPLHGDTFLKNLVTPTYNLGVHNTPTLVTGGAANSPSLSIWRFDGTNDGLDVADAPSVDIPVSQPFLITFWGRTSAASGTFFVCKRTSSTAAGYDLGVNLGAANRFSMRLREGATTRQVNYSNAVTVNGLWHLYGGIVDFVGDTGYVLFDGTRQGTPVSLAGDTNYGSSAKLAIGYRPAGTPDGYIAADIRDVRIYHRPPNISFERSLFDPGTRWELYYELHRRIYSFPPVAAVGGEAAQRSPYLMTLGVGAGG